MAEDTIQALGKAIDILEALRQSLACRDALAKPAVTGCALRDLELTVRSYNCLISPQCAGLSDTGPARQVLDYPRPRRIKNFGKVSFIDVLGRLVKDAQIGLAEIQESQFYRTAPRSWRKLWEQKEAANG